MREKRLRRGRGGAYRHITPMSLGGMPACSSWRSSWQTTVASAEFVMLPPGRTHSLHAITLEIRDVVSIQKQVSKGCRSGQHAVKTPATDVQESCCCSARDEGSTIRVRDSVNQCTVVKQIVWNMAYRRVQPISASGVG